MGKVTARDKTLEAVQKCIAERGYVVIGIKPGRETRYRLGEVIHECCGHDLEQPFTIIGVTEHADWLAQCALVGALSEQNQIPGDIYYRAITD